MKDKQPENHRVMDIPILMYHDVFRPGEARTPLSVSESLLASHMDLICKHGYTAMTIKQLFAVVCDGQPCPAKPVIFTFDDGYSSFHDIVTPMAVKRRMTATTFLLSGMLGDHNSWDAKNGAPRASLMSENQVRAILAAGMEIGVHGCFHRRLMESTPAEVQEEIAGAKNSLESRFQVPLQSYCYAFGRFAPSLFPILEQAGYRGAVSIRSPYSRTTTQLYAMRRVHMHEKDKGFRFVLKLTPLYLRYLAYRQRAG